MDVSRYLEPVVSQNAETTRTPMISILVITYNRAHLVSRAIDSILNQTYQDFEIIVINNGSKDHTKEILQQYISKDKVRIYELEQNRKYAGGFNYGLQFVKGVWFTELGDDDFIKPTAFEQLINIPKSIDPTINAVTCNAYNTSTEKMSGFGLDKDQYLPVDKLVAKTEGMFWGITKMELIGNKRLNEKLPGYEHTFWHKIDVLANRYYIHEPLLIWDTAHDLTTSGAYRQPDIKQRECLYSELLNEDSYWVLLKKYNQQLFFVKCLKACFCLKVVDNTKFQKTYKEMFFDENPPLSFKLQYSLISILPKSILYWVFKLHGKAKFTWPFSLCFMKG